MTVRLYDSNRSYMLLEKEYPQTWLPQEGAVLEMHTKLEHPLGNGYYHEIYFEHVHIGYGNAILADKILLDFESDFETVEMHFTIKGKSLATSDSLPKQICFKSYQHNIIYANQLRGSMEWDCEDFQLLEINLAPAFFKRFIPEDSALMDTFRNAIDRKYSCLLAPGHKQISHEMYQIVNDIIHCNRQGVFKRMFLEAKIIELMLLQMEQFADDKATSIYMGRTDVERIYAVRDLILDNLDKTYSLIELAHQVGTNEFTLKKGFRELFGTTVFGFWNDAKMELAKKMLLEQAMNVTEVSDSIGYKNPRHFTAAFKRKYGIVPSQLKTPHILPIAR